MSNADGGQVMLEDWQGLGGGDPGASADGPAARALGQLGAYARPGEPAACWAWAGPRWRGYPVVYVGGARVLVHRVLAQAVQGAPAAGARVRACPRQRDCCNPAHVGAGAADA